MIRFVCPNCGGVIHFLTGEAVCLNLLCKLGHTLTKNKDQNEQPQTKVDPDQHRAEQPPVRGDEDDSGGG